MFNIDTDPIFSRPVKVKVLDGEGHREEIFRATFRALPVGVVSEADLSTELGAREFLVETIVRLDEISDAKGTALPYSEQLRDRVLQRADARGALIRTYLSEVSEAARGN